MVGVLIVTHGRLADEFVRVAADIVGNSERLVSVCIDRSKEVEEVRKEMERALGQVNDGEGVLIFTDMLGGTPSNISLSFLEEGKADVISGINLPMLIKALMSRDGKSLRELALYVREYGEKSISLASEILSMKAARK